MLERTLLFFINTINPIMQLLTDYKQNNSQQLYVASELINSSGCNTGRVAQGVCSASSTWQFIF